VNVPSRFHQPTPQNIDANEKGSNRKLSIGLGAVSIVYGNEIDTDLNKAVEFKELNRANHIQLREAKTASETQTHNEAIKEKISNRSFEVQSDVPLSIIGIKDREGNTLFKATTDNKVAKDMRTNRVSTIETNSTNRMSIKRQTTLRTIKETTCVPPQFPSYAHIVRRLLMQYLLQILIRQNG
jgi:hypothetical protein